MTWTAIENDHGTMEVVPDNDLKPHLLDGRCWCLPFDDRGVLVHNSMDRREVFERKRAKSS